MHACLLTHKLVLPFSSSFATSAVYSAPALSSHDLKAHPCARYIAVVNFCCPLLSTVVYCCCPPLCLALLALVPYLTLCPPFQFEVQTIAAYTFVRLFVNGDLIGQQRLDRIQDVYVSFFNAAAVFGVDNNAPSFSGLLNFVRILGTPCQGLSIVSRVASNTPSPVACVFFVPIVSCLSQLILS